MAEAKKKKKPVWWWRLCFGTPKKTLISLALIGALILSGLWSIALVFAFILFALAIILGYRPRFK